MAASRAREGACLLPTPVSSPASYACEFRFNHEHVRISKNLTMLQFIRLNVISPLKSFLSF